MCKTLNLHRKLLWPPIADIGRLEEEHPIAKVMDIPISEKDPQSHPQKDYKTIKHWKETLFYKAPFNFLYGNWLAMASQRNNWRSDLDEAFPQGPVFITPGGVVMRRHVEERENLSFNPHMDETMTNFEYHLDKKDPISIKLILRIINDRFSPNLVKFSVF